MGIPIADIIGHLESEAEYGLAGNERNIDKGYSHYHSYKVGLGDRMELGVDNDFRGSTVWHAKVLFYEGSNLAFSGGTMNVNFADVEQDAYLVGRIDFPNFRLHGGMMWSDEPRPFLGIDFSLGGDWSASLDHTGGSNAMTWLGLYAPLGKGLNLSVGVGLPSVKEDGIQHAAAVTYGFRF
jgi:hypothetical protein